MRGPGPRSRVPCLCYDGFGAEIGDAPFEGFPARLMGRYEGYLAAGLICLRPTTVIDLNDAMLELGRYLSKT